MSFNPRGRTSQSPEPMSLARIRRWRWSTYTPQTSGTPNGGPAGGVEIVRAERGAAVRSSSTRRSARVPRREELPVERDLRVVDGVVAVGARRPSSPASRTGRPASNCRRRRPRRSPSRRAACPRIRGREVLLVDHEPAAAVRRGHRVVVAVLVRRREPRRRPRTIGAVGWSGRGEPCPHPSTRRRRRGRR